MRKIGVILVTIFLAFSVKMMGQCNPTQTKILLVGDSWAYFADQFNSIDNSLDYYGFSDLSSFTNSDLAVTGTETKWMLEQGTITNISSALNSNPGIEVISVSIGGNDILGDVHVSMDSVQVDSLLTAIIKRIDTITNILDSLKPDVKIYFTAYDFPNFEESINAYQLGPPSSHPFFDTWDGMGQPNYQELNTVLNRFHELLSNHCMNYPTIDFVSAAGLMQFIYGQPYNLPQGPSGTYAPQTAPVPGGFINYPSPLASMNDYGVFYDSFHLSDEAFDHFYNYHFKHYFYNMLRTHRRDATFTSNGNGEDGFINVSTTNTQSLALGSDGLNNYSSILSFNTSSLLDTNIQSSSIFLKRDSLLGSQPLQNGRVLVSIKNGSFSGNQLLETSDASASADATDTACFYGTNNADGNIIRVDLPVSLLDHINDTGITQIRISAIEGIAGELFFSLSDTNFPVSMDVKYGTPPISTVDEIETKDLSLTVYPNPTNADFIQIKTNVSTKELAIIDSKGIVKTKQITNQHIDVSDLAKGFYIIQLVDENQQLIQTKFIKL